MFGKARAIGVAWFREEDYQRIREISDDDMIPTFVEWEAKMLQLLARPAPPGVILEKVIIDPEELLDFARRHHAGKIDSQVRGAFAATLVAKKYGTNH